MTLEDALAACEATVRQTDPDRYFANLFARAERRPLLHALYAFNHETARAGEVAREPLMGEIRLQWWREALEAARDGHPRNHPAAIGLAEIFARAAPPFELFEQLLDARSGAASGEPFPDLAALESYAQSTSANLMQIAAHVLDVDANVEEVTREAGIAYGLASILRTLPYHARRGRTFLPADLLVAEDLTVAGAMSGRDTIALKRVTDKVVSAARTHFRRAREMPLPGRVAAAVLPAAMVPLHLARIRRADAMAPPRDFSTVRRQLVLLRAALLGRL
jgi:phytoene synthase